MEAREKGFPYWRADRKTVRGWIWSLSYQNNYHKTHKEKARAADKKYYDKMKLLYGGNPRVNPLARIRWLMAKNVNRKNPPLKDKASGL